MKSRIIMLAALVSWLVLLVSVGFAAKGKKAPPSSESATEEKVKELAKNEHPSPKVITTTSSEIPDKKAQPASPIKPVQPQPTQAQPSPQIKPVEVQPTQVLVAPAAGDKGRQIKWQVLSGAGGAASASKSHQMTYSVGQGAIGYTGSDSYQAVQGFQTGVVGGGGEFICGDANEDEIINVGDIVYLVSYLYRGGPVPVPAACVGDVNSDEVVNVGDIVYLVSYLYRGGPTPHPDCCG